jgi:hypothetical protein
MITMHIGLNFGWVRHWYSNKELSTETARTFVKNVFALTSEAALSHKEDVVCQEYRAQR